ncbi:hypothetical protein D3C87_1676050 [compost metagenome]
MVRGQPLVGVSELNLNRIRSFILQWPGNILIDSLCVFEYQYRSFMTSAAFRCRLGLNPIQTIEGPAQIVVFFKKRLQMIDLFQYIVLDFHKNPALHIDQLNITCLSFLVTRLFLDIGIEMLRHCRVDLDILVG